MDIASQSPLVVCDIFIHSIIFHTLNNSSQLLRGQLLTTDSTITNNNNLASYHIGLQFTGTTTPVPSIIIPLTDQITLQQKIAINLGQNETCIIEKGKSIVVQFSSLLSTLNPSTYNGIPPQLTLVLLSSTDTNQGAQFVGNGTISLQHMLQAITKSVSNLATDNEQQTPSGVSNTNTLEQFRIPIYDLVSQKIASLLVSIRIGCVPDHLYAFFTQQIISQSATLYQQQQQTIPNNNTLTSTLPSSNTNPVSNPTLHLPIRSVSTADSTILKPNDNNTEKFQRTMEKTIERGTKELKSNNVYTPPPIWYGNIGPITIPVVPPQPPNNTNNPSKSPPGEEPNTIKTEKLSVPTIHSMSIGFQEPEITIKPVLEKENGKSVNILTGEEDTEMLDELLAELIRWRDVVRQTEIEQTQTLSSPNKKQTTKTNPLSINNPLKDGISSSMAALQKALLSSGMTEALANRLVHTLGKTHMHTMESTGNQIPPAIQDFVKRGVSFTSTTDIHKHPLFGSEERTQILASAFPRTFRVLRGADTPEEMQQAIETIYSVQEQRKSLRSNVYKNGILINDPGSTSFTSVPSSPFAGSPLRQNQLENNTNNLVKSPKSVGIASPNSILRKKSLNSFTTTDGMPLPSTLMNSPYAKSVLPPRRASQVQPKVSNTTPNLNKTSDSIFTNQTSERRESIGGQSNQNSENEPVRGVRLTTAMRARLAALDEEKRMERLQASREASILSIAEANGPIWVERERRRRLSHDRHSLSTYRSDDIHIDQDNKNNITFQSTNSNNDLLTQAEKDARRSAGYRAPVEPNQIRSLRTSPHKNALELMPSARTKVSSTSSMPTHPESDRSIPSNTVVVPKDHPTRESMELPNTSVLVTSNPGQSALMNTNASTINHTTNGETFNITTYDDKNPSKYNSELPNTSEKFIPVNNEESILQLSVSGSPTKLQAMLSPVDNNGVPLYQTADASMISTVPSAPSSSITGGDNSQNITRKSEDNSLLSPDLNATGMSNTHLSALGLGLGATGKKVRKSDSEGEDSEEYNGPQPTNLLGTLASPLSDSTSSSDISNRHSTFRNTDKYANERVKAAMERIAAATSSDSFGSVSSMSESNDTSSVLSPPSGTKQHHRGSRFALSGSSDDILIETSNDDDDEDLHKPKYTHQRQSQFQADLGDDDDEEEEEEDDDDDAYDF